MCSPASVKLYIHNMFASFLFLFFGGLFLYIMQKGANTLFLQKSFFIKNIHTCYIPLWTLCLFVINLSLSPLLTQDVLEKVNFVWS